MEPQKLVTLLIDSSEIRPASYCRTRNVFAVTQIITSTSEYNLACVGGSREMGTADSGTILGRRGAPANAFGIRKLL